MREGKKNEYNPLVLMTFEDQIQNVLVHLNQYEWHLFAIDEDRKIHMQHRRTHLRQLKIFIIKLKSDLNRIKDQIFQEKNLTSLIRNILTPFFIVIYFDFLLQIRNEP